MFRCMNKQVFVRIHMLEFRCCISLDIRESVPRLIQEIGSSCDWFDFVSQIGSHSDRMYAKPCLPGGNTDKLNVPPESHLMFSFVKSLVAPIVCCGLALFIGSGSSKQIWRSQEWVGYGGNAQHSATSYSLSASPLTKILWSTPVDLLPQYSGSELLIHYAPPMITYSGNVLVTVKTGVAGLFEVQARTPQTGSLLWTQMTDYILPSAGWTPTCGSSLDGLTGMVTPGLGGTVYFRSRTDIANSPVTQWAFYGISSYKANKNNYNSNVFICTPLTVDDAGNVFFGFRVTGSTPTGLQSGIAKISPNGTGTWISAATAAGDSSINEPQMNCTPALSNDQRTVYIGVSNNGGGGYLVGLDAQTFKPKYSVQLIDPRTQGQAQLLDLSTASPMIGPDGDVFFGVFEAGFYNDRGWMLHFDETLTKTKIPGSFGWDNTGSIVPSECVPSYKGKSKYLILTKYNNYVGLGPMGDGTNRVAVLDPNGATPDPLNGVSPTTNQPV